MCVNMLPEGIEFTEELRKREERKLLKMQRILGKKLDERNRELNEEWAEKRKLAIAEEIAKHKKQAEDDYLNRVETSTAAPLDKPEETYLWWLKDKR